MNLFNEINKTSIALGERNDCTVKAVALTAKVDYAVAHKALSKAGRRKGSGAYRHQQVIALEAIGAKRVVLETPMQPNGSRYTTKTITKALPGKGNFYVFTARHALAVIDGVVEDWSATRAKRVTEVWEIIPAGKSAPAAPIAKPSTKKVGAKVEVNGTVYRSVKQAFEALGLDLKKHQAFRYELKRSPNGQLDFNGITFRVAA